MGQTKLGLVSGPRRKMFGGGLNLTENSHDGIERLKGFLSYFERNSKDHSGFSAQSFATQKIATVRVIEIVESKATIEEKRERIDKIISDVDKSNCHTGSGWLDFKMHVNSWLTSGNG